MRETKEGPDRETAVGRRPKVTARGEGEALRVLGDAQRVKLTGADTGGRFTLIENENPPGTTLPLHRHRREDEIFYVVEGRVEFTIDGERVTGEAGATVLLPRGVPHTWEVVGDGPARMLIMLLPAGLEDFFRRVTVLSEDGPPEPERLGPLAEEFGIEILDGDGGPPA